MITTLLAMQQADTAFPSGAFAFSSGIEGVTALFDAFDVAALRRHAEVTIRHRWGGLDRVAVAHAWRAGGDLEQLSRIDDAIEAASVVASFREGSRRVGRALLTSHVRLGTPRADILKAAVGSGQLIGHLGTMQGALYRAIGLDEAEAMAVSGYQAVAGLASAAVRLGRIGALEAQAVVRDLLHGIAAFAVPDTVGPTLDLESFAPLLDVAAMRNAEADVRLFAS